MEDKKQLNSNVSWVDRITKELKAQREWKEKWACLNDLDLYGDSASQISRAPPTKWSAFSILNPPSGNPLTSRPVTPSDNPHLSANSFKVTGDRTRFLQGSRRIRDESAGNFYTTNNSYGGGDNGVRGDMGRAGGASSSLLQTSDGYSDLQKQNLSMSGSRLSVQNRASLLSYNGGGRAAAATARTVAPVKKYKYPATSSMEYGWHWAADNGGRRSLELYGNLGAHNH